MANTPDRSLLRKVVAASIIGATLEWYDFFLCGVAAGVVFNKLYFPHSEPLVSTLLAYGSWAVGYVSRPFGSIAFGHFGDRFGRKKMMVLTIMIMGVSTVLVGCLPTYQQIGIWAPLALITLRTLQGIGLGGEWGGAVLMTYEYAKENKRGFFASLSQIGISLGLFAASGAMGAMTTMLSKEQFMSFGWRIPFLFSSVLLLVGWYIRANIMETPDFRKLQEAQKDQKKAKVKVPIMELFRSFKSATAAGFFVRCIGGVGFSIFAIYVIVYLTDVLKVSRGEALFAVNIGTVVCTLMIPLSGWLGDKYGRLNMFIVGSLLESCLAFPVFWLLKTNPHNIWLICLATAASLGVCHGMISGLTASVLSDLFPTRVRYTGTSFVFSTSGLVWSGITPMIALFLVRYNNNNPWLLSGYIVASGLVSAVASWWVIRHAARKAGEQPRSIAGVAGS
jgi:MFS family permease